MSPILPSINLLSKRREFYDKKLVAVNKSKVYAGVVLAVYVVILIGVYAWGLVVAEKANETESSLGEVKLGIASKAPVEQEWRHMISKTKTIHGLLQKRATISSLWQQVHSMFPNNVEIQTFDYEGNDLHIAVKIPHVIAASQVLDILENNQQGFKVTKSTIQVSRSANAVYTIDVVMNLSSDKVETGKL